MFPIVLPSLGFSAVASCATEACCSAISSGRVCEATAGCWLDRSSASGQCRRVALAAPLVEHPASLVDQPAALVPGIKIAVTQALLDYAIDLALPYGLQYLRTYPLPNPIAKGDDDSVSWEVKDAKIDSVNAQAAMALSAPNVVGVSITDLVRRARPRRPAPLDTRQIGLLLFSPQHSRASTPPPCLPNRQAVTLHATVHGREDVWPHPSVSGGVKASTGSSSSATIAFAIAVADGVPTASVASCDTHLDITGIHISGLGILDPIGDLIAKSFKGEIEHAIKKAICEQAVAVALSDVINPFLHGFTYEEKLPLPAPFDRAMLDNHLTSSPAVVSNGSTYLELAATGEVFRSDTNASSPAAHSPYTPAALPHLSAAQLGSHMVSTVVGEYPINSALWTFWREGALSYTVDKTQLPAAAQPMLTTAFYEHVLMPRLYEAYPNDDMTLTVAAQTAPLWRVTPQMLTLSANVTLAFRVKQANATNATSSPLAFSLWTIFTTKVHLSAVEGTPPRIIGHLDDVSCELHVGALPFGGVAPSLLSAISDPANLALNYLILPGLNKRLAAGIPIPPIVAELGSGADRAKLTVNFHRPALLQYDGFLLVGTDANATITPGAARLAAA